MPVLVGYKLIDKRTREVVKEWGGLYGQAPAIPNPLNLPNGDSLHNPQLDTDYGDYSFIRWEMDESEKPPKTVIEGDKFLERVTDKEYELITRSDDIQVQRWLDIFRLRGEIDINSKTAQAAKEGLIALGLLTKERAEEIFKPE